MGPGELDGIELTVGNWQTHHFITFRFSCFVCQVHSLGLSCNNLSKQVGFEIFGIVTDSMALQPSLPPLALGRYSLNNTIVVTGVIHNNDGVFGYMGQELAVPPSHKILLIHFIVVEDLAWNTCSAPSTQPFAVPACSTISHPPLPLGHFQPASPSPSTHMVSCLW